VKGPVQGADTRKGHPAFGILDEQAPEHLELVGDPGFHDGVVDVADHHVPAAVGRDEDQALRAHRAEGIVARELRGSQRHVYAATYGEPPDPPAVAALVSALAEAAA